MTKLTILALSFCLLTGRAVAETDAQARLAASSLTRSATERGAVVEITPLRTLSRARVRAQLLAAEMPADSVHYPVELYRVVYGTIDPAWQPITASALIALPRSHQRQLPLVSFTHGTEIFRGDAPSVSNDPWAIGPALSYAAAGFAVVAPDYLGMGVGPGPHPWMHVPSEVSSALDALSAARSFVAERRIRLQRGVFVTGFSQGSLAALALGMVLEQGAHPTFGLAALAPISGPYRWTQWVRDAALGAGPVPPKAATVYLAYLSVAWNRVYGLYDAPSEFYLAPHDRAIEALFDGTHTGDEVLANTPETPAELFTPYALARLAAPDDQLARPLARIDSLCGGWSPRAPVLLLAASGDESVPIANAEACKTALSARGVEPGLIDLGELDHLGTNRLAHAEVLAFFEDIAAERDE